MSILFKWVSRVLIGSFVLAFLVILVSYHLASRSLPKYNQSLISDNIKDNIEIIRDSSNIPHIFSKNDSDAFFALGYAHAQDRFWQLNIFIREE